MQGRNTDVCGNGTGQMITTTNCVASKEICAFSFTSPPIGGEDSRGGGRMTGHLYYENLPKATLVHTRAGPPAVGGGSELCCFHDRRDTPGDGTGRLSWGEDRHPDI